MSRISNKTFYTASLKKYGKTPQGLHWHSQPSQFIRFEAIESLLPQNMQNYTLMDVGCGFGDLYHHLHVKPKKYTGVDILEEMVTIAKEHTQQEILLHDATTDTLPPHDYVVCSGALNILSRYETTAFIHNCYKASRKAFVFNALYGDIQSQQYNYLQKEFLFNIAKSLHVTNVVFKEHYIDNDITVGFFR